MKAILDIPDASLLATSSLEELIDQFCLKSGVTRPDVISLPIWDEGGPQYESAFASSEKSLWKRYKIDREIERIRDSYKDIKIYLSIMPDLPGIKSGHLTCRDQFGDEKARVCIVNPNTQSLVIKVISEAVQRFSPDGIVLDIVDIHPQGSNSTRKYVELSCFCDHCKRIMDDMKFDADSFKKLHSPLNLVLNATQTGISYITPESSQNPDEIVQEALRKGYISSADDVIYSEWAQTILRYIQVRSKMTGAAIGKIRNKVKTNNPNLRFGVILNTNSFDWTGGSDLQGMIGHVDEVWLDINDLNERTAPTDVEIYAYTVDRSRYRVDAFFEFASDRTLIETALGTGRETIESLLETMRERAVGLEAADNLDKSVVNSFSDMSFVNGFVGIPLSKLFYQTLLQEVRKEATLIANVVEQEQSISGEKFREYMVNLIQLAEQGLAIGRREIIGLAAQMKLID